MVINVHQSKTWIFDIDSILEAKKTFAIDDMKKTLQGLKTAGKKILLISGKKRSDIEISLAKDDLLKYFEVLYCFEDAHDDFASDEYFEEFIAANLVIPEECTFVSTKESKADKFGFNVLLLNVDTRFSTLAKKKFK